MESKKLAGTQLQDALLDAILEYMRVKTQYAADTATEGYALLKIGESFKRLSKLPAREQFDDRGRARMGVTAATGQQGGRGDDRGGEDERGATAAVQGSLPRRLCGGAQSLAVIDGRQWLASRPAIRPTMHDDFGHRRTSHRDQPVIATGASHASRSTVIGVTESHSSTCR